MRDDEYRSMLAEIDPAPGLRAAARDALKLTDVERGQRELRYILDPILFYLAKQHADTTIANPERLLSVKRLDESAAFAVTAPRHLHGDIQTAVRLYLPMTIRVDIMPA